MGAQIVQICGKTDFFQELLQKYGDEFVKLVCSQKAKQMLEQKFKEVIAKLRQYVSMFENKINSIIDEKIKYLSENFDNLKTKMNNLIPGGIAYLERKNGKSINQFSGFNKFLQKIDSIRDQTLVKVQSQRNQVQKQLHQKKTMIYNEIEQQRPKVPLYEQLPQNIRLKILNKADTQFREKIDESNQKIGDKANRKFNTSFNQLDNFLNDLNPDTFLDNFVQKSVKQMVTNVTGNGVGGKFNGLIDKVF